MSTFTVPIIKIKAIEPIAGADAIELAVVGDYRSVVKKGDFNVGDLAVYIPEAAIVPNWLLQEMNLVGKLAGSEKNRVRAVKLRGCLSQGLLLQIGQPGGSFYPDHCTIVSEEVDGNQGGFIAIEGEDVKDQLGIIKWEPPVPTQMAGEVYNAGQRLTVAYDIENFKKYPTVLVEGEDVVFAEKLHGSFCGVGYLPEQDWDEKHIEGKFVVFSKGLGSQGLCFKDNDANVNNIYLRTLKKHGILEKLRCNASILKVLGKPEPLFLLGEVFGKGVQDLEYVQDVSFRVFEVVVGYRGDQRYLNYDGKAVFCNEAKLDMVPLLYYGPFSKDVMQQHTDGKETVSGKQLHIREGIVVTPTKERFDSQLGRVILKSVSEHYLLRKGSHVTEFS